MADLVVRRLRYCAAALVALVAGWFVVIVVAMATITGCSGAKRGSPVAPSAPAETMRAPDGPPVSDPYDLPSSGDLFEFADQVGSPLLVVHFAFDSDVIPVRETGALRQLGEHTVALGTTLRLVGHTCDIGTEDYNLGLGLRRAMSVRQALIVLGVSPGALEVESRGEADLLETRPQSRRVEVWAR